MDQTISSLLIVSVVCSEGFLSNTCAVELYSFISINCCTSPVFAWQQTDSFAGKSRPKRHICPKTAWPSRKCDEKLGPGASAGDCWKILLRAWAQKTLGYRITPAVPKRLCCYFQSRGGLMSLILISNDPANGFSGHVGVKA